MVVDELTPQVVALLSKARPGFVFYVESGIDRNDPTWNRLPLTEDEGPSDLL